MYKVLGQDGVERGPVDETILKRWVSQRRIFPETVLVDLRTGHPLPAHQVACLQPVFSALAEPPPVIGAGRPGARRGRLLTLGLAGVSLAVGYLLGRADPARTHGRPLSLLQQSGRPRPLAPLEPIAAPRPARVGWPYPDRTPGTVLPATAQERASGWVPAYRYSTDWGKLAASLLTEQEEHVARRAARLKRRGRLLKVPPRVEARIVDHKAVYPFWLYKVRFTSGPHSGRTAWLLHQAFYPKPGTVPGEPAGENPTVAARGDGPSPREIQGTARTISIISRS